MRNDIIELLLGLLIGILIIKIERERPKYTYHGINSKYIKNKEFEIDGGRYKFEPYIIHR